MSLSSQQIELITYMKGLLKPKPYLTGSQWMDKYFYLSPESSAKPGKWTSHPWQRDLIDRMTDFEAKIVVFQKPTRVGFALALDTKISTSSGWSTIGMSKVGDMLFDEKGIPCRITDKSEIFINHKCFEIEFCDGTKIKADADHRWLVSAKKQPVSKPNGYQKPLWEDVINTEEIFKRHKFGKNSDNLFSIKNTKPLDTKSKLLPVPPYTLGLWLGDGHSVTPKITQHRLDVETAHHIRREGIAVSVKFDDKRYKNNASYYLNNIIKNGRNYSSLVSNFKSLNVMSIGGKCDTKHIPNIYMRSSREQRLELLRGLMDSDGTISKKHSRGEFTNTNKKLIYGVYELLVSLGYKAVVRGRKTPKSSILDQYRVNFKCHPDMNPFNLSRKANLVKSLKKPSITMERTIVSVKKIPTEPMQCISVDSKSQLFLCSESMIPTHNTKMMNGVKAYFIHQQPCVILDYQPTDDEAKGYAEDEFEPMLRDNPIISKLVETPSVRGRQKREKTIKKRYPSGLIEMLGAESDRNLNRRTARVAMGDEIDTWKKEAGKAGDTITQMMRRTSDFVYRKNILGGKPIGGEFDSEKEMDDSISVVNYWYQQGDMCLRYLPCPHCGHMQVFEFEDFVWDKDKNKDGVTLQHHPETVRVHCAECDAAIYDKDKRKMDELGEWRASQPFTGIASARIWAFLSDSPNVTWTHIVKEFLTAKKSKAKMKAFTNEVLARTWEEDYEKADTSEMMERREEYPAQVPDPVLVLTVGADVQKDRIECEVIGWLNNYESYAIEYKKFFGDTTQPEVWETLREYILAKRWYREDGETMSVYAGCIDAGYLTDTVTAFCKPLYSKRIFPTQGHTSITAKINPGVVGRTKKNKNRIFTIGVNKAKDEIAWHIASKGGAGFMHFPVDDDYNDEYFKQLGAEKKEKNGRWIKTRNRNEVIDMRVYNYVALALAAVDMELLSLRGPMTNASQIITKKRRRVLSKGIRR